MSMIKNSPKFTVDRIIYGAATGKRRDIILLLHKEGPLTLSKLRATLGISPSTLLFELSALEKLGVVRREDSLVALTELGERVASIISTAAPLKSLDFISVLGLRPLVIWLLMSPRLTITASILLATWVIALVIGGLQNPPLSMIYVLYIGYYLPLSLGLSAPLSIASSLLSLTILISAVYFLSHRKISPFKTAIGVFPIALYPAAHLTIVQIARSLEYTYLITVSQILLFVALLLTATVFASVYSLEVGTTYEASLVRALLLFFVIPSLFYLVPLHNAL
ncbi:helix-turn-helix domain-containing protein [Pyrobaculum aerophilum]|uniref:helix-turn-helix domain-containing protein n=1 Tax=Pyrobaculum aerophilum TaxID=13773 RepID=UPI0023F54A8D|nr:helix-turn-helix domain-containing protein [Pyrobaculum aerophilum]MCX8137299.1 ArsR family transcriptional regulator [Pyrobaculum aerophilum]